MWNGVRVLIPHPFKTVTVCVCVCIVFTFKNFINVCDVFRSYVYLTLSSNTFWITTHSTSLPNFMVSFLFCLINHWVQRVWYLYACAWCYPLEHKPHTRSHTPEEWVSLLQEPSDSTSSSDTWKHHCSACGFIIVFSYKPKTQHWFVFPLVTLNYGLQTVVHWILTFNIVLSVWVIF